MKLETILNRNQIKYATKYLKEASKEVKSGALGYCSKENVNDNDYQVLTNSYSCILLSEGLDLPECPNKLSFPKVERIFDMVLNSKNTEVEIDFDDLYQKSKEYRKTKEETKIYKVKVDNDIAYFDVKILMDTFKALGTTEVDLSMRGKLEPLLIKCKNNNNMALCLPIKVYK